MLNHGPRQAVHYLPYLAKQPLIEASGDRISVHFRAIDAGAESR